VRRALTAALVLAWPALAPSAARAAPVVPASDLWATVNRCDPPEHPGAVGVRYSVPRRRGGGAQWARVRLQFFDGQVRAWRALRSAAGRGRFVRLGDGVGTVMSGRTFTFPLPAAGRRLVLRGRVDVEWRRGPKVLDRRRMLTTGGHADPADPALAVSRRSCEIRR
jgi:hypothetical protein